MKHLYIPLLLFIFLVLEGVAQEFLPSTLVYGNWLIIPHFVLVYLVMIAVFYDNDRTYYVVLYGIIFGIMIDIVYTNILGIYMFVYALTAYAVHGIKKMLHGNFIVALLLSAAAVAIGDTGVHIIYSFIEGNTIGIGESLTRRLIPSILANLIFFLLIYPLTKNSLERLASSRRERNNAVS